MSNYNSNLEQWGDVGELYPQGYNYLQGEPPVEEWDNFFNHNVERDIDHLIRLTNKRIETRYGDTLSRPDSPEDAATLYLDTSEDVLHMWSESTTSWLDVAMVSGLEETEDRLDGRIDDHLADLGNPHATTLEEARQEGNSFNGPISTDSMVVGGEIDASGQNITGSVYYADDGGTNGFRIESADNQSRYTLSGGYTTMYNMGDTNEGFRFRDTTGLGDLFIVSSSGDASLDYGSLSVADGITIGTETVTTDVDLTSHSDSTGGVHGIADTDTVAGISDIDTHESSVDEVHGIAAGDAVAAVSEVDTVQSNLDTHTGDTGNPHATGLEQARQQGDTMNGNIAITGTNAEIQLPDVSGNSGIQMTDGNNVSSHSGYGTLYSYSTQGSNGWRIRDPDGNGNLFLVDSAGNAMVHNTLEASQLSIGRDGLKASDSWMEIDGGSNGLLIEYYNQQEVRIGNGSAQVSINDGAPVISASQGNEGYEIQKNGTDGNGIINFKT